MFKDDQMDIVNGEYVLTETGVLNNLYYTTTELKQRLGANYKREIKKACKHVYTYMYQQLVHASDEKKLRYMISENAMNQRKHLMRAFLEMVEAEIESDMGMKMYIDGKLQVPDSVKINLRRGQLIGHGRIMIDVPEDFE